MDVLFLEARSDVELSTGFMKKILEKANGKKVGLASTIQYLNQLYILKEYLEKNEKKTLLSPSPRTRNSGQILGCSVMKYNTDSIVYLGTGSFHPTGLGLGNSCKIISANPETGEVSEVSKQVIEKYKTKIRVNKELVKRANVIGILISSKEGQGNKDKAVLLKEKLESEGKKAYLLYFDTLNFDSLLNFSTVDAFINVACPRLFDDIEKFNKPIINIYDYEKNND